MDFHGPPGGRGHQLRGLSGLLGCFGGALSSGPSPADNVARSHRAYFVGRWRTCFLPRPLDTKTPFPEFGVTQIYPRYPRYSSHGSLSPGVEKCHEPTLTWGTGGKSSVCPPVIQVFLPRRLHLAVSSRGVGVELLPLRRIIAGGSALANAEHLSQLMLGVEQWNEWVRLQRVQQQASNHYTGTRHEGTRVGVSSFWADLSEADLSEWNLYQGKRGAGFTGIDLIGADLRGANLNRVNLAWANLTGATLSGADLRDAGLANASIHGANLSGADLRGANIAGTIFLAANLREAELAKANLYETVFSDTDLTDAVGLDACRFAGPCVVDHRTLLAYAALPETFLRGCGLPDMLIADALAVSQEPIQFYSCFISHSSQDQEFVERLYANLQAEGIRCWYAPQDLGIGQRIWDAIDAALKVHDKLLLICSTASIESEWVEDEVNKALAEERERKNIVLFPVRIDDAVMVTEEPWARRIRDSRNIGDFTRWKDHDAYKAAFQRLLKDLSIAQIGH